MPKHTPTPWNCASAFSSVVGVPIIAQNGKRIGNTALPNMPENMPSEWDEFKRDAVANAAFIVKVVNAHEAVVKALEECAARCRYDGDLLHDQGNAPRMRASWNAADMAEAALALISGEASGLMPDR